MKHILKSKSFWLNLIAGIIAILGFISPELLAALGITNPAQFMTIIGAVTALLNIILRTWFTTKPIKTKKAIRAKRVNNIVG